MYKLSNSDFTRSMNSDHFATAITNNPEFQFDQEDISQFRRDFRAFLETLIFVCTDEPRRESNELPQKPASKASGKRKAANKGSGRHKYHSDSEDTDLKPPPAKKPRGRPPKVVRLTVRCRICNKLAFGRPYEELQKPQYHHLLRAHDEENHEYYTHWEAATTRALAPTVPQVGDDPEEDHYRYSFTLGLRYAMLHIYNHLVYAPQEDDERLKTYTGFIGLVSGRFVGARVCLTYSNQPGSNLRNEKFKWLDRNHHLKTRQQDDVYDYTSTVLTELHKDSFREQYENLPFRERVNLYQDLFATPFVMRSAMNGRFFVPCPNTEPEEFKWRWKDHQKLGAKSGQASNKKQHQKRRNRTVKPDTKNG